MSNFQGQLCWYDHPTPNAKKTTILAAAESVRTCTFFQHSCVEARAENWLKRFAGGNNCQARALQTTRAFWTILIWHCIALGGKPRAKDFLVQKGAINIYLAFHAIFFLRRRQGNEDELHRVRANCFYSGRREKGPQDLMEMICFVRRNGICSSGELEEESVLRLKVPFFLLSI